MLVDFSYTRKFMTGWISIYLKEENACDIRYILEVTNFPKWNNIFGVELCLKCCEFIYMSIVSPCLFRYGYKSPACSNLAQVCLVPSAFICLKEAWTMWTEKCLTVVVRHKAPASLRWSQWSHLCFCHQQGKTSREVAQSISRWSLLEKIYSVYLFETTTQGSVPKVLWQKPAETLV